MTARTPIEAWPGRAVSGKPGYSARHYASLAGAENDPLRVASRIVCASIGDTLWHEAQLKLAAGESHRAVMDWLGDERSLREFRAWNVLCADFGAVIKALEDAPFPLQVKAQLREARRAARGAS